MEKLTTTEAYRLYNKIESGLIPSAEVSSAYVKIIEGLLDVEAADLIFEACEGLDDLELKRSMYIKIAKESLEKGNFLNAQKAYTALGDREGIQKTGEAALQSKKFYAAQEAYTALGDREGIQKTGEAALQSKKFYAAQEA